MNALTSFSFTNPSEWVDVVAQWDIDTNGLPEQNIDCCKKIAKYNFKASAFNASTTLGGLAAANLVILGVQACFFYGMAAFALRAVASNWIRPVKKEEPPKEGGMLKRVGSIFTHMVSNSDAQDPLFAELGIQPIRGWSAYRVIGGYTVWANTIPYPGTAPIPVHA